MQSIKPTRSKITQIIPATHGWYCVFRDPEGMFHMPVAAWAVNSDFQMLPMIDNGSGRIEAEYAHDSLIYSPSKTPEDEESIG